MQVTDMPIDNIKLAEDNPRFNDEAVEPVAKSINRYGWQQPIVVDRNMEVVVGNTRLKAAKKLGLDTVPVVVADELTDKQILAYRIADNRVAERADWDFDLFESESKDFAQDVLDDFKLEDLEPQDGVDLSEFDDILDNTRIYGYKYYVDVIPDDDKYDEVLNRMEQLAEEYGVKVKETRLRK